MIYGFVEKNVYLLATRVVIIGIHVSLMSEACVKFVVKNEKHQINYANLDASYFLEHISVYQNMSINLLKILK